MSFFSEGKGSELKDLFFESAGELLQTLNEEGLALEKRPGDVEVVRSVRRTVHTLKGDSAACGYTELSSLAHELEDVLTPELAQKEKRRIAEVVLSSADTFQAMLSAYRANSAPPSGDNIRQLIRALGVDGGKKARPQKPIRPTVRFQWTEYGRMVIADAAGRGLKVIQVSMSVDPNCQIRAAALPMVKNALQELGTLLTISPEETTNEKPVEVIEAALASSFDEEYIAGKCRIPSVISEVFVERYQSAAESHPVGGILTAPLQAKEADILDISPEQPARGAGSLHAAPQPDEEAHSTNLSEVKTVGSIESTLRVDAEKIDAVLNLVGELIIGKSMLTQSINEFDKRFAKDPLRAKFADALAYQARVLNDLQKSVMKVRMVPVEQLFRRFPRIVRDVSKSLGKEVNLVMGGENTDLDKSILDVLAEPMAHLVRNAIGHGIESPIDRMSAGKATLGTLKLNAYHQGNHIVIEVSDDGAGIDVQRVTAQAIAQGLISKEDAGNLTEGEALDFIFHPGLSTAAEVTEVSGRGVGMDVVKTVLESLKGTVSLKSKPGQGTTFYLKVPLTLAIIKALLFRSGERLYAVPLGSVLQITRALESDIHRVDQHEVIRLREQVLTLVRVNKLSAMRPGKAKKIFVIVISIGDRKFGLIVDKLVGEEELVIKALDDHLVATDLVSGASILGDGSVVLILNVNAVVSRLGKGQPFGSSAQGATA